MIEVESETADFQGFSSALVLPGVDTRIQLLKNLIVPRKKRAIEYLRITEVQCRLDRLCSDDHALGLRLHGGELNIGSGSGVSGHRYVPG